MVLFHDPTQQAPNASDYKLDQNTQNHFYVPLAWAKPTEQCPAASGLL